MSLSNLDYFFPFLVFFYGILMIFVLEALPFKALTGNSVKTLYAHLEGHKSLAWTCFWVGGIWSLQNLIFG